MAEPELYLSRAIARLVEHHEFSAALNPSLPVNGDDLYEQLRHIASQSVQAVERSERAATDGLKPDHAVFMVRALMAAAERCQEPLYLYRALPAAAAFHASMARERLITGSNRSGKTQAACVEVARAILGLDPRYPKRDGVGVIVAQDQRALGEVVGKKLLFDSGFMKYQHPKTRQWKLASPNDPEDMEHRRLWVSAGPMIPSRLLVNDCISWYSKKAGQPKTIYFPHNGWKIYCFSANAIPLKGIAVEFVWFDEEITNELWYPEMSARLVDRQGYFWWSVTPEVGTRQFSELYEKATRPNATAAAHFHMHIKDNFFLAESAKKEFLAKLQALGAAKVKQKWDGVPVAIGAKVFPEFSKEGPHVMNAFPVPPCWSIYVAIDPGRQVAAGVICGVPQPNCREHEPCRSAPPGAVYLIGESVVEESDPNSFAKLLAERLEGHSVTEILIDDMSGRQRPIGSPGDKSISELYAEAFERHGIKSDIPGFTPGANDPETRAEIIRTFLIGDGTSDSPKPKVFVFRGRCERTIWELERYRYVTDKQTGLVRRTSKGRPMLAGRDDHCVDCVGYLLSHPLRWRPKKQFRINRTEEARRRWALMEARRARYLASLSGGIA